MTVTATTTGELKLAGWRRQDAEIVTIPSRY